MAPVPYPNPMRQPQQGQQMPTMQGAMQGLFGQNMLPFWAGLAFGGTRQDQGRLASQALQQGNALAQNQAQFQQEHSLAQQQMSALERYRAAQLGLQRQQLALSGRQDPYSAAAKIRQDIVNGFLSPEEGQRQIDLLAQNNTQFNVDIPSGYAPVMNEQNQVTGLQPIPGGPATTIPAETAGKAAMATTAKQYFQSARDFYTGGGYDKGDRARDLGVPFMGRPASGGESGRARRSVGLAVETALRLATGQAATNAEVERFTEMFAPGPFDTQDTIKQKLDMLETFITNAEAAATRGRGGPIRPEELVPSAPSSGNATRRRFTADGELQ